MLSQQTQIVLIALVAIVAIIMSAVVLNKVTNKESFATRGCKTVSDCGTRSCYINPTPPDFNRTWGSPTCKSGQCYQEYETKTGQFKETTCGWL